MSIAIIINLSTIYSFLNSNLFQTVITLLVGLIAYLVFRLQKADGKRNAARSLLLEIQNAERTIKKIRNNLQKNSLESDVTVMQSESWSKYKYLFVRDFDNDEWDLIDSFYNKASLLDAAITFNNSFFGGDVEAIRSNRQRILADIIKEFLDNHNKKKDVVHLIEELDKKVKSFDQTYMSKQGEFAYWPQKPINDAKLYIEDLPVITTSSAGTKLKAMAGVNNK